MKKKVKDSKENKKVKTKEKKVKNKKGFNIKNKVKNMKSKTKVVWKTIFVIFLSVIVCLLFNPIFKNLNFGLDLQGGFEILYQVKPLDNSKMTKDKLNATYKSMLKRIDTLGVSEPEITLEGEDKIRVKLAGVTNQEEARKSLSTVASLSFRDANDKLLMDSNVLKAGGAKVTTDSKGNPAVLLSVKDKDKFYKVTNKVKNYKDNVIVIWLDYEEGYDTYESSKGMCGAGGASHCLSAATVSQGFASDVIIQGNFSADEAEDLVDLINSGSLPTKLTEISSKTVGASFGDATLTKTLVAGIIGITVIIAMLFMIYHFAGLISALSILLYTLLVFAIFWLVGGVLTLPGIAALILGIGMAVDANVLSFSRIKEELVKGRSLKTAFKNGSKQSFKTILDANLTTFLVALIMFNFGESSVKGFATMLIINIGVTMFTMVAMTRVFMKMFIKTDFFDNKLGLFLNVYLDEEENKREKKQRNFLKLGRPVIIVASIIILAGGIMLGVKGFNLGIDYQAGSEITMVTSQGLNEKELEKDLESLDLNKADIKFSSEDTSIRVKNILAEDKVTEVKEYFESRYNAKVDISVISNVVKQDLIKNAIFAICLSLIGIILYITFRFKFSYGICSVVCLLHDILMMVAGMVILRIELNSMFIAAVLAIIGYSINNTIVVFDRIRENMDKKNSEKLTEQELKDIVNISMSQTMLRSIYTSLTTLLPVVALMILGSRELLTFNLAMTIGLIAGTISSIFLASFMWFNISKKSLYKEKNNKKNQKKEIKEKVIAGIND